MLTATVVPGWWRWLVVALILALAGLGDAPAAQAQGDAFELLPPTRQNLRRVQDAWQRWVQAYYANDQLGADAAIEELLSVSRYLGMTRLPDLSLAAGAYAVRSAREGKLERADWALVAARRLDSNRPETDFAAAAVYGHANRFLASGISFVRGYSRLLEQPTARRLWLGNLGLMGLYALLLSGGFFIALQMLSKGQALLSDVQRFLPDHLPMAMLWLLPIPILVWPLALPNGLLWLALYWSLLLWGYLSSSERWVLSGVWLLVGLLPLVLPFQQSWAQHQLSPPVRLLDSVADGSLYGDLFIDLEALEALLPESSAVDELQADLYRRLGQWEHAKVLYQRLLEAEPGNAPASVNLAVYAHRERDFVQAIELNKAATEIDPALTEGFYNLSQAYAQTYQFSEANQALAQARALDSDRVSSWVEDESRREKPVAVEGSLLRSDEIRQALEAGWERKDTFGAWLANWQSWRSLLAFLLLMIGGRWLAKVLRSNAGRRYSSASAAPRAPWLRALLPGAVSAEDGHGVRAFMALLPVTVCLLVPLIRRLGWRLPLGFEPATWWLVAVALVALGVLWVIRLRVELAD